MIHNARALVSTLLAPLCLAGDWSADRPTFAPKAGTSLTKTLSVQGDLELEEMKLMMGGQDLSEMAGQMEMSMKHETRLVVEDTYVALEDGRPTKLKRTYEEIGSSSHSSGSSMMGEQKNDSKFESDLEGKSVLFTLDGDEYSATFADDEKGDEELLEGLVEDIDLRGFLPSKEVAEDDSWKVEAAAVKALLVPGGDLKLKPAEGADMPGLESMNFSPSDMLSELEGTFEATFKGTRKEGDVTVAVIAVAIDCSSANDLTERMQSMTDAMDDQLPEGASMKVTAFDGEYEYEAEGELLWNLESGHLHALQLSGELRMIMDVSMSMSMQGMDNDMELSQTYAGSQTLTLTTAQ